MVKNAKLELRFSAPTEESQNTDGETCTLFSLTELIDAARRELERRKRMYPKMARAGKFPMQAGNREIDQMQAILNILLDCEKKLALKTG